MPAVDPVLSAYAFELDLGLTREQYLATPKPSQLCDDLEASEELAALERLDPGVRLDDLAVTFRRSVIDAGAAPTRRACELVVGCVALARRTIAELEVRAELGERETHLAASVVLEAERIVRTSSL